jgi:hypothetical protein
MSLNIDTIKEAFGWRKKPTILSDSSQLTYGEAEGLSQLEMMPPELVDVAFLEKHHDLIFWLTPEAFCYYLQYIMRLSITALCADMLVVRSIVTTLDRPVAIPSEWDDFARKRWTLLTSSELTAVEGWMWWLQSTRVFADDVIERVLENIALLKRASRASQEIDSRNFHSAPIPEP